jgi:hypothetical protein
MVLERRIVWYSECNEFFSVLTIFLYILKHVSAVRGHRQVFYINSFFYINLALLFATPTLANVCINGGGGCCLPFGVCFHQC